MATDTNEHAESSIDTVLTAVKTGFDRIDQRLRRVEDKFQGMDRQLFSVEGRLLIMEKTLVDHGVRLGRLDDGLTTLTASVDRFATMFTDLHHEVSSLRQQLQQIDVRVRHVERDDAAA